MDAIAYYPLHLKITGRRCLVAGGGRVGIRKARTLARCGGRPVIVSPRLDAPLPKGITQAITHIPEPYDPAHLEGAFLVFAATDQADLNRQIARDARQAGILCNIADNPEASDFILPAMVNRGDLILTVSTCGCSPAFAGIVKNELEDRFGEGYGEFLFLMGRIRKRLLARDHDPEGHKAVFNRLIQADLPGMVMDHDIEGIDRLLHDTLGDGFTYHHLTAGEMP